MVRRESARSALRGERLTGVVCPGHGLSKPMMFLERPAVVDANAACDALVLHLPMASIFADIEHSPRSARRIIAGLSTRVESLVHELKREALGSGRAPLTENGCNLLICRCS